MGPIWGPRGADRTQVGPMLSTWTLLSGKLLIAHTCYMYIMARRICINRFWLAGGKAIILIGFPFYTCIVGVNPQPWMPINTQTNECIASIRSAWVAPILPNTLLKSWTEILQKSVQSWYIPFALQVCYDNRANKIVHVQQLRVLENEVLACKFDIQDPSPYSPPEC